MSTDDRRAPGATRIPFEALVEVGGALGPSFEAEAIDISEEGMHLRTAYLPEIGQPLSCRFEAGGSGSVIASGEVIWKQEAGKGGEFGIRFTDLDGQSAESLQRMMGVGQAPPPPTQQSKGNRVRLHIEGLGSPMRARVKDANSARVTAFSELGFLQVGKPLELEDAATGTKRPAYIDRVECEIDPESRVPQLVVSLRYDDAEAHAADAMRAKEHTPEPMVTHGEPEEESFEVKEEAPAQSQHRSEASELESIERAGDEMRGFVARSAAKVTPALEQMMSRAKTTIALLAAKRRGGSGDDVAIPLRRRTSPPPQGALHSSGRKVVRDSMPGVEGSSAARRSQHMKDIPEETPKKPLNRKRLAIGAGAVSALVIVGFLMHKPSAPPVAEGDATQTTAAGPLAATTADAPLAAPPSVLSPVAPAAPAASPVQNMPTAASDGMRASEVPSNDVLDESSSSSSDHHARRRVHVAPFSNGPVAHGNVLRIKMDGAIDKIEGDASPTGFTVVIPGRRSLEPAGPLAARDGRIASIRVTNDGTGAELSVSFKDGVPNYLVRAKGDVLEMVFAPNGTLSESIRPARATSAPAAHPHRRHGHH